MLIYKACEAGLWRKAAAQGRFDGASVDLTDGFIHFSTRGQLPETLRKHFAGKTDLVLIAVEAAALGAALKWEKSRGGAHFPHLYGPLDTRLALWTKALPEIPADRGVDVLPRDPGLWETMGMQALRLTDPERAHGLALRAMDLGLAPRPTPPIPDAALVTQVFGLRFPNPVGLAAGFDKNAFAPDALLNYGFGFVEIGAVTPRPQIGNPRPRLFRLTEDRAVINRMGFNNDGLAVVRRRLESRRNRPGLLGVNIGANKDSADRAGDYVTVLRELYGLCQFFTVNVSSPNTERLRDLQGKAALDALLGRVMTARDEAHAATGEKTPVLLKIAPDLTDDEIADIAEVALARDLDGIVATNTTLGGRDAARDPQRSQTGGLSGAPLFARSTEVLRALRRRLNGAIPLIGVGGVGSGAQAYAKIKAGADLVQLYSALVFEGPNLAGRIVEDLSELLRVDGFSAIEDAVGVEA